MRGEIILYTTEDGRSAIQLKAKDGSVWLTQAEIAELFDTSVSNINKHIKAIVDEDEQPQATVEHCSIVQIEGAGASLARSPPTWSSPSYRLWPASR
jgi:hypothetical protein